VREGEAVRWRRKGLGQPKAYRTDFYALVFMDEAVAATAGEMTQLVDRMDG